MAPFFLRMHSQDARASQVDDGFVASLLNSSRMFTGLVEGQGIVRQIAELPAGLRFSIVPQDDCFSASEVEIGDSIANSGCCLTVVQNRDGVLEFEAGLETLSKTNLGSLKVGDAVNLERSLRVGARLGGHFVQGHVDGTAVVDDIVRDDEWVDMWFQAPADLLRLMVPKGSITIDGVSLTLVNIQPARFSVSLIPHTLQATTLGRRRVGDTVNVENDILGKYVAQLLQHHPSISSGQPSP